MKRLVTLLAIVTVLAGACRDPTPAPTPTPVALATAPPSPTRRDTARFAAVGDVGEPNATSRAVAARIAALHGEAPLDALLLLGDLIYPDGDGSRYAPKFAEPFAPVLDAGIRMAAALGNHDVQTRAGADVMERFGMPGRSYTFTIGPVAFFALDTNRLDREQLAWLDGALAATSAPWRVLFMHVPAHSSGMHGSSPAVRDALGPLLREHGVQLVLAGHDHHYERTHPIGGTVFVVAGTGCCVRRTGRSDFTAAAASRPGVLLAEVSEDRLVLRAVDADGTVFDEAAIGRAPVPAGAGFGGNG